MRDAAVDEVRIEVHDAGPGLNPDELARLFRPFTRGRNVSDVGGGMGLGLYLSRLLAERHGGHLWLESIPGVGTTAILTLPIPSETDA